MECLAELEKLGEQGLIDIFYGDESHVCSEGYVPYGWQFAHENVCILVEKGHKVNCWGLISRNNQCHWATREQTIDSQFILEQMETLSFTINKTTFIVLDCAKIHTAKIIEERRAFWQKRGLFIFFLPPYSPQLNLAETLWRKLKKEWLNPEYYLEKDCLFYAVNRSLANVGVKFKINLKKFRLN